MTNRHKRKKSYSVFLLSLALHPSAFDFGIKTRRKALHESVILLRGFCSDAERFNASG